LSNDDLLRPTLSGYRKPPALYNSTGFFLSAFFGGPAGAGLYAACNTFRLGRLSRDLPIIIAIIAGAFLLLIELQRMGVLSQLDQYLGGSKARNLEIYLRALGIACFGAIYLLHRGFFRAAQVSGLKPLPGWVPGIAAVLAGYLANVAFAAWIEHH
jgi:hypothetical protein